MSISKAEEMFKQFNYPVCLARSILIKSNFFKESGDMYQDKFIDCLNDLMFAQGIFEQKLYTEHHVKSLIYISLIYIRLEEYQDAKKFIQQAIGYAREIHDHQQVKFATELLNDIIHKIQVRSNNSIVFLNSFPIVS